MATCLVETRETCTAQQLSGDPGSLVFGQCLYISIQIWLTRPIFRIAYSPLTFRFGGFDRASLTVVIN